MTLILVVVGLAMLAVPGAFRTRLQHLTPGQWARVCRNSLLTGSGLLVAGLSLWGIPAVLHAADGTGISAFCDGAVHALPIGGVYVATAMLVVATGLAAGLVRAVLVALRGLSDARVDPFIGRHRQVGEFDVVVVPSTRLVACAVSGSHPQIVLSDALVDHLEADQVQAVVRHEMAHHRLRHRRYLVLASAIDRALGWLPFVRSSTRSLRDALEHWADDVSTAGSQRRVEGLRSALSRIGTVDGTTPVKYAIDRRIGHLDRRTPARGRGTARTVYLAAAAASIAAVSGLVVASALQLVAVLGRCST